MPPNNSNTNLKHFLSVLTDEPVGSVVELHLRCNALSQLSKFNSTSIDMMPAILRSLVVPVKVDCVLALRVAPAEALWRVCGRHDLALPFLVWAIRDEQFGVSHQAVSVLGEMGDLAYDTVPDLINFMNRRLKNGPFFYEKIGIGSDSPSLIASIAIALGNCARSERHSEAAREALLQLSDCDDAEARVAAKESINILEKRST